MTRKPEDVVLIRVTAKDLYLELQTIKKQAEEYSRKNEEKHEEIIQKLDVFVKINAVEHEKMKGSVNVVKATLVGVSTLATMAIAWIMSQIR